MADDPLKEGVPFYFSQNDALQLARPEDEFLHPKSFENITDVSATETQYFGFCVPQARIEGFCYMWHQPNLNIATGGVYAGKGVKSTNIHCELSDYVTYMDDGFLANDLHNYTMVNSYGVRVIEPLKKFHMTYEDPARQNAIDLYFDAVSPAVMFGDGLHFEQSMKVTGELTLRGEHFDVDSYTTRDRSWGKPRPQVNMCLPPLSWCVGVFSDDFSFNASVLDQPKNNPVLKGELALPHDQTLKGGWIYRDKQLGRIIRAEKRVERKPGSLEALSIALELTDEHGREFDIKGLLLASLPLQAGTFMWARMNLMEWRCNGETAYGDLQEGFWNDYLNLTR